MRVSRLAIVAVATASLAGCALTPPEEDPVQIRLNDLDTRIQRLERLLTNQSLLDLAQRIDRLQGDVRALRGELEQLENQSQSGQKQQRDLYADVDRRLVALEGGRAPSPPSGTEAASTLGAGENRGAVAASSATEQRGYDQAFEALKAADYARAISGFKQFLSTYPSSPLASNAQYWLGEAYYVTRDYPNAASAFQRVVNDWPDARKAPDALVKLGFTQFEQKRYTAARTTLREVEQRYPGTDAARLAADRLKRFPPDVR